MGAPRALQLHAGPRARQHLRDHGLRPADVRVVAGAAGGPKGLVLLPLDEFIFGDWLGRGGHEVDLVGASIGAWRMAAACTPNPVVALQQLAHDYIHERYGDVPGVMPPAAEVTRRFASTLHRHFGSQVQAVRAHPRWKLHIATSHGRGILRREGPVRMPFGFAAAVALNAIDRRLLQLMLERVWFSASGTAPSWLKDELRTTAVELRSDNFEQALLASCTIPFWLEAIHDIPGGPQGAYWDGGLVDYHTHLPYANLPHGLALIPHFQPQLVPGWLDKPIRRRHAATSKLDNAIVVSPRPEWVSTLPGGKIPDRSDFKTFLHHPEERERRWHRAWSESRRLADEWAACVAQPSIEALPLP